MSDLLDWMETNEGEKTVQPAPQRKARPAAGGGVHFLSPQGVIVRPGWDTPPEAGRTPEERGMPRQASRPFEGATSTNVLQTPGGMGGPLPPTPAERTPGEALAWAAQGLGSDLGVQFPPTDTPSRAGGMELPAVTVDECRELQGVAEAFVGEGKRGEALEAYAALAGRLWALCRAQQAHAENIKAAELDMAAEGASDVSLGASGVSGASGARWKSPARSEASRTTGGATSVLTPGTAQECVEAAERARHLAEEAATNARRNLDALRATLERETESLRSCLRSAEDRATQATRERDEALGRANLAEMRALNAENDATTARDAAQSVLADVAFAREAVDRMEKRQTELEERNAELVRENASLHASLRALSAAASDAESATLRQELEVLRSQLQSLESRDASADERALQLEERLLQAESAAQDMSQRMREASAARAASERDCARLQGQVTALEATLRSTEEARDAATTRLAALLRHQSDAKKDGDKEGVKEGEKEGEKEVAEMRARLEAAEERAMEVETTRAHQDVVLAQAKEQAQLAESRVAALLALSRALLAEVRQRRALASEPSWTVGAPDAATDLILPAAQRVQQQHREEKVEEERKMEVATSHRPSSTPQQATGGVPLAALIFTPPPLSGSVVRAAAAARHVARNVAVMPAMWGSEAVGTMSSLDWSVSDSLDVSRSFARLERGTAPSAAQAQAHAEAEAAAVALLLSPGMRAGDGEGEADALDASPLSFGSSALALGAANVRVLAATDKEGAGDAEEGKDAGETEGEAEGAVAAIALAAVAGVRVASEREAARAGAAILTSPLATMLRDAGISVSQLMSEAAAVAGPLHVLEETGEVIAQSAAAEQTPSPARRYNAASPRLLAHALASREAEAARLRLELDGLRRAEAVLRSQLAAQTEHCAALARSRDRSVKEAQDARDEARSARLAARQAAAEMDALRAAQAVAQDSAQLVQSAQEARDAERAALAEADAMRERLASVSARAEAAEAALVAATASMRQRDTSRTSMYYAVTNNSSNSTSTTTNTATNVVSVGAAEGGASSLQAQVRRSMEEVRSLHERLKRGERERKELEARLSSVVSAAQSADNGRVEAMAAATASQALCAQLRQRLEESEKEQERAVESARAEVALLRSTTQQARGDAERLAHEVELARSQARNSDARAAEAEQSADALRTSLRDAGLRARAVALERDEALKTRDEALRARDEVQAAAEQLRVSAVRGAEELRSHAARESELEQALEAREKDVRALVDLARETQTRAAALEQQLHVADERADCAIRAAEQAAEATVAWRKATVAARAAADSAQAQLEDVLRARRDAVECGVQFDRTGVFSDKGFQTSFADNNRTAGSGGLGATGRSSAGLDATATATATSTSTSRRQYRQDSFAALLAAVEHREDEDEAQERKEETEQEALPSTGTGTGMELAASFAAARAECEALRAELALANRLAEQARGFVSQLQHRVNEEAESAHRELATTLATLAQPPVLPPMSALPPLPLSSPEQGSSASSSSALGASSSFLFTRPSRAAEPLSPASPASADILRSAARLEKSLSDVAGSAVAPSPSMSSATLSPKAAATMPLQPTPMATPMAATLPVMPTPAAARAPSPPPVPPTQPVFRLRLSDWDPADPQTLASLRRLREGIAAAADALSGPTPKEDAQVQVVDEEEDGEEEEEEVEESNDAVTELRSVPHQQHQHTTLSSSSSSSTEHRSMGTVSSATMMSSQLVVRAPQAVEVSTLAKHGGEEMGNLARRLPMHTPWTQRQRGTQPLPLDGFVSSAVTAAHTHFTTSLARAHAPLPFAIRSMPSVPPVAPGAPVAPTAAAPASAVDAPSTPPRATSTAPADRPVVKRERDVPTPSIPRIGGREVSSSRPSTAASSSTSLVAASKTSVAHPRSVRTTARSRAASSTSTSATTTTSTTTTSTTSAAVAPKRRGLAPVAERQPRASSDGQWAPLREGAATPVPKGRGKSVTIHGDWAALPADSKVVHGPSTPAARAHPNHSTPAIATLSVRQLAVE